MKYQINDQVLFKGTKAKVTCILSDNRYQVYTQNGEVLLAYESELVRV